MVNRLLGSDHSVVGLRLSAELPVILGNLPETECNHELS
jgi:hypothetical protein